MMVEIDSDMMHKLRTTNIQFQIDGIVSMLTQINDRLYCIMEFMPQAKKKFEELQESRTKLSGG